MFNRLRNVRKGWRLAIVSAALLSVGLVTGIVLAAAERSESFSNAPYEGYGFGDERAGMGNGGAVMSRVAEILRIEEATLEAAFATAFDESADAKFEGYVQGLVDDETLTSEQGVEANDWFDERPANSGPLALRLAGISDSDRVDVMLAKMVESGWMTQDEADSVSDWHDARPDSLPTATRHHAGGWKGHHGGEEDDG